MPRLQLRARTALSLVLFWACTQPASIEPGALVATDSAGVRIFAADTAGAEQWGVAPEPTWVVGRQDAGGPVLHEVSDARILPNDDIAIANGSTREILVVDPGSGLRARMGGEGDGPAELQSLARILPRDAGRVGAFDRVRRRVVVFDTDGRFVEARPLPEIAVPSALPVIVPVDEDGYYLAFIAGLSDRRTGVFRGEAPLFRVTGSRVDTVTRIPGSAVFVTEERMGMVPFGAGAAVAGSGEGVWVGDQAEHEARFWTTGPSPERIVRWTDLPDRTLTEERIDAFIRSGLDALPPGAPRDRVEAQLRSLPFPAEIPAYSDVVAGEGTLWIGGFVSRTLEAAGVRALAQSWLIVDFVRMRTARLVAPEGLRITQVGGGWIVGIHTDSLGVETVRRYEVVPEEPVADA